MQILPTIVWFRRDLRLLDDPALNAAARRGAPVIPVFVFAPEESDEWRLGAMLGQSKEHSGTRQLLKSYWVELSAVMKWTPSRRKQTNVLQHMADFISNRIDSGDQKELSRSIEIYRRERLPLIVPVTLIHLYVRRLGIEYLRDQV
jgi:uncharacterized protein YbgA (DUF1722 family)